MERKCSSCGARISDGMKICANCGKVVPQLRPVHSSDSSYTVRQRNNQKVKSMPKPAREQSANRQAIPQNRQVKSNQNRSVASKPLKNQQAVMPQKKTYVKSAGKTESNVKSKVLKCTKIAAVILIIYVIISVIQIFRVRLSTYDFKVDMKMSKENYGQAIDSFFDGGLWTYNPFTFTVTYKGEKQREGEYELKFSAVGSVKLKAVIVDGSEKDSDRLESAIMGLFI